MARKTLAAAALALGAVLAASGNAAAGDNAPAKSGFSGGPIASGSASGITMTLGGQGTASQAAGFDDTELARGGGRGGGGYHGGGGGRGGGGYHGGGYRGGYGGGYRGGYGGGYYGGGYGGGYYGGGYYGGGYYDGGYYDGGYPYYPPYVGYYGGYGYGGFRGGYGHHGYGYRRISGTSADLDAPAVTLGLAVVRNPVVQQPVSVPGPSADPGTFRYDGGPASPVPFPPQDGKPNGQVTPVVPPAPGLPVSLTKPTNPYTFKAYGEK